MGHVRLGALPRTRKWQQVVGLLEGGAGTAEIAAGAMEASKSDLKQAAQDPALGHAFWLLTQIPLCARHADFGKRLQQKGLEVSAAPTLMEIAGAFTDAVDDHIRKHGGRTDLGEMAQLAAVESLTALASQRARRLFGYTPEDVRDTLRSFSTSRQFAVLARDFFARLTRRYLGYFLSRELSNHVGGEQRFFNVEEHIEFTNALETHCRQASRIIQEFAGGWFSKTNFEGRITPEKVAGFIHIALKKVGSELAKGA